MSEYDPDLYDAIYPGSLDGDLEWYRALAEDAGAPVLELGAGTGRTVIPIARAGIEIDALELDVGMLARLEQRLAEEPEEVRQHVRLIPGDMRRFRLPRTYTLIQIPFRGFLHNITGEEQLTCLRCCRDHLRPGGLLALNVFHPSLDIMSENRGALAGVWRWDGEATHPDGGVVICSQTTRYNTPRQRLTARLRFEHFDENGSLVHCHLQRLEVAYLYPGDVRALLEQAGFTDITIDGGFDGRPFANDGDELVIRARKPA